MPREWTDEEVSEEISKAVQIVREDRIDTLIRNRLSTPSPNPGDTKDKAPESGGNTSDDNNGGDTQPKRKSLWWGEIDELSGRLSSANAGKGA